MQEHKELYGKPVYSQDLEFRNPIRLWLNENRTVAFLDDRDYNDEQVMSQAYTPEVYLIQPDAQFDVLLLKSLDKARNALNRITDVFLATTIVGLLLFALVALIAPINLEKPLAVTLVVVFLVWRCLEAYIEKHVVTKKKLMDMLTERFIGVPYEGIDRFWSYATPHDIDALITAKNKSDDIYESLKDRLDARYAELANEETREAQLAGGVMTPQDHARIQSEREADAIFNRLYPLDDPYMGHAIEMEDLERNAAEDNAGAGEVSETPEYTNVKTTVLPETKPEGNTES